MTATSRSSVILIGESSLAKFCGEALLRKGFDLGAVISRDPSLASWARSANLNFFSPEAGSADGDKSPQNNTERIAEFLKTLEFDWLFSVVNPFILTREILERPRRKAVNYHDAPLPRYAGLNATIWAILNGETEHGITWHEMTETLDAGPILKQKPVAVEPADTAYSLNAKCYEAAAAAFEELLDEILADQLRPVAQDLSRRTYFDAAARPPNQGIIDWNADGTEIERLVRALDFGPIENPLAMPKAIIGGQCLCLREASFQSGKSQHPPGTICKISVDELSIAVGKGQLAIRNFTVPAGRSIAPDEVARMADLVEGKQIDPLSPNERASLIETCGELARHESFWVRRLKNLSPLDLRALTSGFRLKDGQGFHALEIEPKMFHPLAAQIGSPDLKTESLALACVGSFLYRLTGNGRFDLGFFDDSSRNLKKQSYGLVSGTVPFCFNFDRDETFTTAVSAIARELSRLRKRRSFLNDVFQRYPSVSRRISGDEPLFPVQISCANRELAEPDEACELLISLSTDGRLRLRLHAGRIPLFQIHAFEECWKRFLGNLAHDLAIPIARVPLVEKEDCPQKSWQGKIVPTPKDQDLLSLWNNQVERSPDQTAVESAGQALTYRELDSRSERLAELLEQPGANSSNVVAICLERSLNWVTALWGVLKAGGIFLSLDPRWPAKRIADMLKDSGATRLLIDSQSAESASLSEIKHTMEECQRLDLATIDWNKLPDPKAPRSRALDPDQPAYLLYTSGSTGHPKGVLVSHGNLCNHGVSIRDLFGLIPRDRVLQFASLSFDVALEELFPSWISGATVSLRSETMLGERFLDEVEERRLSVLNLPTGFWRTLIREASRTGRTLPDCVRLVIVGGEAVPAEDWLAWKEWTGNRARLLNGYGPTETTISSTFFEESDSTVDVSDFVNVPIGKPIANTRVYLLDQEQQAVPAGVEGEIYIGGKGVALGYWNQPDLTATAFPKDPFSSEPEARMYRTGDRGRWLPDGNLQFSGRRDEQVKIRGYRVEPGEVESAIREHPSIRDAAVVVRDRNQNGGFLVAFITLKPGAPKPAHDELKDFLTARLPDYMIPSLFHLPEEMPLLPNGKLDRQALVEASEGVSLQTRDTTPPRNEIEAALASSWSELFGIDSPGIKVNFFELGGHSLLAMRLLSRIRNQFNVEVALNELLARPTIEDMARLVQSSRPASRERIESNARPDPVPLSFAQERMWFYYRLHPRNGVYNIPLAWRLKGPLNATALEEALNDIVARHESLRTVFRERDGNPIQIVQEPKKRTLTIADADDLAAEQKEAWIRDRLAREARTPFDLTQSPPLRWGLIRLSDEDHVLWINQHHIVTDEWSGGIFERELSAFYEARVRGEVAELKTLPAQYADLAVRERRRFEQGELERQRLYWREKLKGAPAVLDLPSDKPRPARQTFRGAQVRDSLDEEFVEALRQMGAKRNATLFMTLLAAYSHLLSVYSRQKELTIGAPVANRGAEPAQDLIGLFLNTLVLRINLEGELSFEQLLERVRSETLDAAENSEYPFERLVEELQPARDPSRHPLFQVMFVLENREPGMPRLTGLKVTPEEIDLETAKFELTLTAREEGERLFLYLNYNTDLFESATARRMLEHYLELLKAVVRQPDRPLSQGSLMTAKERRMILEEWNDTRAAYRTGACLQDLFEEQAARTPDAPAVIFENRQLSYAEFNRQANQLAHWLRQQGVGPEVRVGLLMERSLEMALGIYGTLKAGGAYVPLEPDQPKARLEQMAKDAGLRVLLTQEKFSDRVSDLPGRKLFLDAQWEEVAGQSQENPERLANERHLAYVIYTSGSTGQPKGVMIEHAAILNRLFWMRETFELDATERILQKTPYGFDVSVPEFLGPMLHGAALVIAPPNAHQDPAEILRLIERDRITMVHFVPSMLRAFLDQPELSRTRGLRRVICSGEALSPALVNAFLKRMPEGIELHNLYGPTEAAVEVTHWPCHPNPDMQRVPIGKPLANTQTYIVDEHLQPAPVGVAGELLLGGAQLARGYLNRPELTAEAFIANPFPAPAGSRLYRTGDLARYRTDGNIEFLGRLDHQVKIRGQRIEPGEIEAALRHFSPIGQIVVSDVAGPNGELQLAAFYTTRRGAEAPTPAELRSHLKRRLPDYMVPSHFVAMGYLPLTPSGKVDRKALRLPESGSLPQSEEFTPPGGKVEKKLAALWEELLGVRPIGIRDNFFDLGGHSLLATRLLARVNSTFGVVYALPRFFYGPTIAEMTETIELLQWSGREETGGDKEIREDYDEELI